MIVNFVPYVVVIALGDIVKSIISFRCSVSIVNTASSYGMLSLINLIPHAT